MKSFIILILALSFNCAQASEGDVEIKIPSLEFGPVAVGIYKSASTIIFHRSANKLEVTVENKGRQIAPVKFRSFGSLVVQGSAQALDKLVACLSPQPQLDKWKRSIRMTKPVQLNFSGSSINSNSRILELPEAFSCTAL